MLSLILAESSLELVPNKLCSHPSVKAHAKKLAKNSSEILLDNSWHFSAMKGLKDEFKRGRPDLVHFCLMQATSIPLFQEGQLEIYIHTINDKVITVGNNVRLPKSYHRFAGLMEKLFKEKTIKSDNDVLLDICNMTFSELINEISPKSVIGLSTQGTTSTFCDIAKNLDDSCLVIGGFQKGSFSEQVNDQITSLYKISHKTFEAHIILGRLLYEYEKTLFTS